MNTSAVPATLDPTMKGTTTMLLEEALARSRMREAEHAAHQYRQARRLASARTWQRLAGWTARRAAHARSAL